MALAPQPQALTRSAEDYLKAIYTLSADGAAAATSEIASRLAISPPSVSGMLRRLAEGGLIRHAPYRGVELTEAGRRLALRVVRRHRIIEAFLVAQLGLSWDEVHHEAERLEHAASDLVVERMAAALGHPEFDPHGDPIPAADGSLPSRPATALTEVKPGDTVTVHRVLTGDAARLRFLASLGLTPGASVTVVERQPFQGVLRLQVDAREQVVGHALAAQLLCEHRGGADA